MRELMVKEGILKEGRKRRFIILSLASLFSIGVVCSTAYYLNDNTNEQENGIGLTNVQTNNNKEIPANDVQETQNPIPVTEAASPAENKTVKTGKKTISSENGDVFLRNLTGTYDENRVYVSKKGEPDEVKKIAPEETSVFDKLSKSPPKAPEAALPAESTKTKKAKTKKSADVVSKNEESAPVAKAAKEKTESKTKKKDAAENATEKNNEEIKNTAGNSTEKVAVDSSLIAKIDSTQKPGGTMDTEFTRILPEKDVVDNNFSRFALGAILSYDIHRYKVVQNTIPGHFNAGEIKEESLAGENNLSYTTGLLARYRLTYNIMVEAGVLYSQKKKVIYTVDGVNVKNDSLSKQYSNFSFHYNAKYIDLPVQAKGFIPIGNNLNIQLSAGALFSLNAPFGSKSYYSYQFVNDAPGNTNPVSTFYAGNKPVSIMPYGGIGLNYLYEGKWEFFLEPSYKFSKNPVLKANTDVPMAAEHYLRTISIGFGCFYNF